MKKPKFNYIVNAALQAAIEQFVAGVEAVDTKAYRSATQLGLDNRDLLTPEDFRLRLIKAGLSRPRASEIKVLLEAPDVATKFVTEVEGYTVKRSLREARAAKGGQEQAPGVAADDGEAVDDPARVAVDALISTMDCLIGMMGREAAWELNCGIGLVRFTPAVGAGLEVTPS